MIDYRGFVIKPLRGSTSIEDAKRGADLLLEAGGLAIPPFSSSPGVADRFRELLRQEFPEAVLCPG